MSEPIIPVKAKNLIEQYFLRNFASMNKLLTILAAICAIACSGNKTTIYNFSTETNSGEELHFSQYKGKVLLIANTASKCGFTPQYDGLEALYQKYAPKGFVVIGFPCDQFGHQEPGSNEEIEEFCRLNHGVTFPLMAKSDVNGENANEVFKWLYSEKPFAGFGDSDTGKFMDGMLSRNDPDYASNPDIKWNFTKFLIDRKGRVVARFEPVVTPEQITPEIEALL
jgi:glutathione peroxidase